MRAVAHKWPLPVKADLAFLDVEVPDPVPGPRDLLVRIAAVSVNPRDTRIRATDKNLDGRPVILGFDASGIVEAVGPQVHLFKPGDAVFYAGVHNRQGTNAELHLVDERIVGPKPVSLSHAEAAALPLTALTAHEMLFDRLGIRPGERGTILIVGGSGGVSSMAVQMARRLTSLEVVGTASRPISEKWVRERGAHQVLNHGQPLEPQYAALGLAAPNYVFSIRGTGERWPELARLLAPQGKIGLIDDPETLDLRLIKAKSASVHWEAVFARPAFETPDMIRQHEILTEVSRLLDKGVLCPTPCRCFGTLCAANLRAAHAAIESGATMGKIVLARFGTKPFSQPDGAL